MKFLDLKKKLDKTYPNSIHSAPTIPNIKRISTGVFVVDLLIGGGIPINRVSIFFGDRSTGKTTLAIRCISEFLKDNPNKIALFIDFEHTFDREWAANILGKTIDRLMVITPDFGEEGVDMIHEAIKAEDIGFVVVDSLADITPIKEVESDSGESQIGLQARLVNKLLRKIVLGISLAKKQGRELTFVLINQITVKIGVRSFQPLMGMPGGVKQGLTASIILRTYTKKYYKVGQEVVKVTHTFTVDKNKVGVPKRSGEYTVYLVPYNNKPVGYVDDVKTVIDTAQSYGLITKVKNKISVADAMFDSMADLHSALEADSKAKKNLATALLDYEMVFEGDEEETTD